MEYGTLEYWVFQKRRTFSICLTHHSTIPCLPAGMIPLFPSMPNIVNFFSKVQLPLNPPPRPSLWLLRAASPYRYERPELYKQYPPPPPHFLPIQSPHPQ